ncbi:MAG: hypothetical protein IT167_24055 [Bryobacterales bacterium]|nr:hypothetical protein [Bryobacterales bacterium]
MAALLNASSQLMCPHGGQVDIITSNTKSKADGAFLVRSADTFTITGCPFAVGPTPHPCVQVNWVLPAAQSKSVQAFHLTEQSVGLCVAADQAVQGTVMVVNTQRKVSGR